MIPQKFKHTITYIFLISFVLLKLSGLHALLHHSQDEFQDCIVCHLSSRDNTTPMIAWDTPIEIGVFFIPVFPEVVDHYHHLPDEKPIISELFNRPPPFYTVS